MILIVLVLTWVFSVFLTPKDKKKLWKLLKGSLSLSDQKPRRKKASQQKQSRKKNQTSSFASSVQGLFSLPKEEFLDKAQYEKIKSMLNGIDLNNITPLQALQLLVKIKEEL